MINLEETIQAQWANSPIMLQLINNMNGYIDPTANLNNFYNQVQNVLTAQGYGLDVWGRIVGVQRTIVIPATASRLYFKESGAGTPFGPGGSAPFWDGTVSGSNFRLSDSAFLTLILTKALANISLCSAPAINQMLRNLFGAQGRCYALDLGGMRMQIIFEFPLSLMDFYILTQSKALARPAGVQAWILPGWAPNQFFGFREAGSTSQPMGFGPFFSGNYQPVLY
jgi:hypothetical protein